MKKWTMFLVIFAMAVGFWTIAIAADLYHNTLAVQAIAPAEVSDTTPSVGNIVDGLGFDSLTYIINIGTLADSDATFTVLLEDCAIDNCADAASVTDANLYGTEAAASFIFSDDDTVTMLGYSGRKRYTRMTVTPANNTGSATFGVVAVKGHPQYVPTQ